MKKKYLHIFTALLIASSFAFSQETSKVEMPKEEKHTPRQYLHSRDRLNPELYSQIDNAVRSSDTSKASKILRAARIKQKADKSAFINTRGLSGELGERKSATIVRTKEDYDKMLVSNGRVPLHREPTIRLGGINEDSLRKRTITIKEYDEGEVPHLVIPTPGSYYTSQAFRLKIAKDGYGMQAYANAALEELRSIADSPDTEISADERIEACIRMADVQKQLLFDYDGARQSYQKALNFNPENDSLRNWLRTVTQEGTSKNGSAKGGVQ